MLNWMRHQTRRDAALIRQTDSPDGVDDGMTDYDAVRCDVDIN